MVGQEYTLGNIFLQALARYGPFVAVALVAVIGAIFLLVRYLSAKIDLMRQHAAAAEADRQTEADRKEREHKALVAELTASRAETRQLMTNHLEHDRQDREKHAQLLGEISKGLQEQGMLSRAIAEDIRSLRKEETDGRGKVHERLGSICERLAGIEGRSLK